MKKVLQHQKYRNYRFGSFSAIPNEDLELLTEMIKDFVPRQTGTLYGRGVVRYCNLPNLGKVVIKQYLRGGLLGNLIGSAYFKLGSSRAETELSFLQEALESNIRVPAPLIAIEEGKHFYRAWLVLQEIPEARNLVDIANKDEAIARVVVEEAAKEIAKLIKARILHVDLHPGNVIVSAENEVYLIDFDKARRFKGRLRGLRDYYLCRWRRACLKHALPEFVNEIMSLNLRRLDAWEEIGEAHVSRG